MARGSRPTTTTAPPSIDGATLSAWRPATTASASIAASTSSSFERSEPAIASAATAPAAAEAAHDLPAGRLRGRVGEADLVGARDRADLLHDVLLELGLQGIARRVPGGQRHEAAERLALELIRLPHHRRFRHLRVRDERA